MAIDPNLQTNVNRLLVSENFNLQVSVATDEVLSQLAAQPAKTPPAPAPPAPPIPTPPIEQKPVPATVQPKNPLQEAEAKIKEALDRAKAAAQNVGQSVRAATQNVSQSVRAAATSVKDAGKKLVNKIRKSDRRLKTDIQLIGQSPSGINMYEFRFIADPSRKYQGVLADELLGTPYANAVYIDADGYYAVDYALIDVMFKEVTEA